ncbi:probable serine hydrolase isoform X2 [Ceratina calcarata]|uniref:Probable serine hydrolase isoform X2 n=1 Tax=Ceratina calcarata TaxID=156304 RepID=A0AAJ7J2F4_9HYME|nr:probable serine hydrolase isoform X2 [Ceratina calcarata]
MSDIIYLKFQARYDDFYTDLRHLWKSAVRWNFSLTKYEQINLLQIFIDYRYSTVSQMSIAAKKSVSENLNGQKLHNVEEIEIPVPWGHISGKWWGPKSEQPLVAIHGWQDNSGTFDRLIPLLSNESVLAIDLPGHGLSSHLPRGQFYYIFCDGLITLRRVAKYFKWNKIKLLGHSLGGAISFLYAASYPDEVEFMISLDIASPSVRDPSKIAPLTGDTIDKYLKYEALEASNVPLYTYNEVLDIVEDAYNGSVSREGAIALMKRGIRPSSNPEKYYFSRDPRLKVSALGMMSMDLVLAYATQIKCAYLNIRAMPGLKLDHPENYDIVMDQIKMGAKKFEYHKVEGSHHVHLNNPEKIASIIDNFLST